MKTQNGPQTEITRSATRSALRFTLVTLLAIAGVASQAATIFTENIGTPGGTTAIASYTGWQNNGVLTFSGTADVRATTASTGYAGASGSGNVFITSTATRFFQIDAINTVGYTALSLSFGALKSTTTSDMTDLVLEYSTDGTTWNVVSFPAQPTGSGTAIWRLISAVSLPVGAENAGNLRLRWTQTAAVTQYRLDDITLTGTPGGGGPVAPIITQNPPAQSTNWPGSTVSFKVAAIGDAPLSYRWQSNLVDLADGGQITGSGTSNLVLSAVDSSLETGYRVIVTNLVGAATSSVVNLVLMSNAPVIYSDPLTRAGILGQTATFQVYAPNPAITGAPANAFRWQSNSVDLVDVGQFSGTGTPKLTITGLTADNAATYTCIVSNDAGSVTSAGASLTVDVSGTLSYWNFNIASNLNSPEVYYGPGTAALVGITNGFIPNAGTSPGNANDPHFGTVSSNRYWGTSGYPPNTSNPSSNKTSGVRFNASTVGLRNVVLTYSTRLIAASSKYSRLQYTTDGSTFTDYPASFTNLAVANAFDFPGHVVDLSGFAGVRDNPNFGFRIVTEQAHTASYGSIPLTNFVALNDTTNSYSSSGTVSFDMVKITAEVTNANLAPTIAAISSFGMLDTDSPTNITITVGDAESPGSLSVTATSFNPAVVADSLSPSTTSMTIAPVAPGTAPILVTVSDPDGNSAAVWFNVTVTPGNFAPTVTGLVNTNAFTNTPVAQAFTIGDDVTPVGSLTVSTFSGNVTLVPNVNTTVTGSGATRSNIVTGVAGSNGIAPISVVVTDAGSPAKSATNSYAVMIRSSTNILAVDSFDYDTADTLIAASKDIWQTHGNPVGSGPVDVSNGKLNLMSPSSDAQDVTLPLIGAPWSTNSDAVLYSKYTAKWLSLPGAIGTYISHYRDTNTAVATGFGARVIASTNIAATATNFTLSIGNGNGWTNINAPFPLALETNVDYTIVTRFVLSNGVSTLWINPTSEGSTSVTATDVSLTNATKNAIDVVGYCFRQSTEQGGMGQIEIDDLVIGTSFAAVMGGTAGPTPENIVFTTSGNDLILSWTQPNWTALLSGPSITSLTTTNLGATSPFTNALSGGPTYFRLYYKP